MGAIVIRCVLIYVLLTFSIRIMGKRQIGELDVGDLVSTLLISELAAIPIDDPDIPLLNAGIPILLIISLEIIISTIKNRSSLLKKAVDGRPVYIIYKGRLLQNTLIDNRISIDELLSEMRGQGIFDISEVEYGILEQNGSLSLFKTSDTAFAHTLMLDGEIFSDSVKLIGAEQIVEKALRGQRLEDIMLLTVDDMGNINMIKKDAESQEEKDGKSEPARRDVMSANGEKVKAAKCNDTSKGNAWDGKKKNNGEGARARGSSAKSKLLKRRK